MYTFTDSELKTIKANTAKNAHGENYALIAASLELKPLQEKFEDINTIHQDMGYMPPTLSKVRYKLYSQMMEQAKPKVTNFTELYGSL